MTYSLFLDDERFPPTYSRFFEDSPPIIVRSYEDFMQLIQEYGPPERVSFDHDLGDWRWTGLDCLKGLITFCAMRKLPFPEFQVHSMNPIGSKAIWDYIYWACDNEDNLQEMYDDGYDVI